MHRTIKAMTVAATIAIGLSLGTGGADAQVPGWNIIRPTACFEYASSSPNGQIVSTLWVYTNTFTITMTDPAGINAATQWCYNGSAFWA